MVRVIPRSEGSGGELLATEGTGAAMCSQRYRCRARQGHVGRSTPAGSPGATTALSVVGYDLCMPIFLCRWLNGDFSIVGARNREDAVIQLDEWGNAEEAQIWPLETCMIDFRLNDAGEIELNDPGFGEEAHSEIMDRCFPELREVLESEAVRSPDTDEYAEAADELIRVAVEHERTRVSGKNGPDAETLAGCDLQQITGAPSALVNRLLRDAASEMLESSDDDQGKPN